MRSKLTEELLQLSPAEKRELGEALIASAEADGGFDPLSDAQRAELRARLAHHRANPGEPGIRLQELMAKLVHKHSVQGARATSKRRLGFLKGKLEIPQDFDGPLPGDREADFAG